MIDLTCRPMLPRVLAACAMAALLAACGGGGGGSSCTSIDPTRSGALPGCGTSSGGNPGGGSTGGNPSTGVTMALPALALVDGAGNGINTITPDKPGVLVATIKDSAGVPMANTAVVLTSTDKNALFSPASGSTITDGSGVARIGIAASGTAGGFTATLVAVKETLSNKASLNYAVAYPALTMSTMAITPSPLSAGGTASVSVTVMNGSTPYTTPLTVTFTSTCTAATKASLGLPVLTVNGVATTAYVDKGCGAADPITATATLGGAVFSQVGTVTTLGTTAGQITFVSASPLNIALRGTGGAGRQESSVVTFKVLDRNGLPVPNAPVSFALSGATGTGTVTIAPATATSTADGTVTTTVFAGIVPTSVRILATLTGSSPLLTTVSDQLVVSTGLPHQKGISLSTTIFNVEGGNHDGCVSPIGSTVMAMLTDHFGNPAPDGTAVNFTAEGGQIGASCLTGVDGVRGACTVKFCSAEPRVADQRYTIMAYALGEESYVENPALPNSINHYDAGEAYDDMCEPVRYDNAINDTIANGTLKDSKVSACTAPTVGQAYIDTNGNGSFNATGDNVYNGVLNDDPAGRATIHVRRSLVQVMSHSEAAITPTAGVTAGNVALASCTDGTAFVNTPVLVTMYIRDRNSTIFPGNTLPGNVLPAGTTIGFSATNGNILGPTSYKVLSTNEPSQSVWAYSFFMESDATQTAALVCSNSRRSGTLQVTATSPLGIVTHMTYTVSD